MVLLAGVLTTLLFNSCKKDKQESLRDYLSTYGSWQLVSLQSTSVKRFNTPVTDTLVTTCGTDRLSFDFDGSGNVICRNFQCLKNTTSGNWTLNKDSLMLHINVKVKDMISKSTTQNKDVPFADAYIETLGRNAFVIIVGDIKPYYADDKTHVSYRYSFIHPAGVITK
ncbi:hypothetical protein GCM10027037_21010 [Mucilaginibacter koreensis]